MKTEISYFWIHPVGATSFGALPTLYSLLARQQWFSWARQCYPFTAVVQLPLTILSHVLLQILTLPKPPSSAESEGFDQMIRRTLVGLSGEGLSAAGEASLVLCTFLRPILVCQHHLRRHHQW